MGVRKYRSVEEVPEEELLPPLDPGNLEAVCALMELARRLSAGRFDAGVRRFRSYDELREERERRRPPGAP